MMAIPILLDLCLYFTVTLWLEQLMFKAQNTGGMFDGKKMASQKPQVISRYISLGWTVSCGLSHLQGKMEMLKFLVELSISFF